MIDFSGCRQVFYCFLVSILLTSCFVKKWGGKKGDRSNEPSTPEKTQEKKNPDDSKDPEIDPSTFEKFIGFDQCCSDRFKQLIDKNFGESSNFVQGIDSFVESRPASPFYMLNKTGGYRHISGEAIVFENDTAKFNLIAGKWSSIRYGMKYDKLENSGIRGDAVLNKNIGSDFQGVLDTLNLEVKSGSGILKIRLYREPTGRNIDNTVSFRQEDIILEHTLNILEGQSDYSVDLYHNVRNETITQVEVIAEGPAQLAIDSVSFGIKFNKKMPRLVSTFAFLLSSILDGFDEKNGLVYDSARSLRRTVGYASSVTGMLGGALVAAADLGVIEKNVAKGLFQKIANKGLKTLKRYSHKGWLVHWIILDGNVEVEYSVVDSALFYLPILIGAKYFELQDETKFLYESIKEIEFSDLIVDGKISLGFDTNGKPFSYYYDVIGGEFVLIEILKSISKPELPPLNLSLWTSWHDIGFIPEVANLFFRQFGTLDTSDEVFKFNWYQERQRVYNSQKSALARSPIFGYSECEIITESGMREYAKLGASEIAKEYHLDYAWFTPSYIFMTSMLRPTEFVKNLKFFESHIEPISSVPECMKVDLNTKKIVGYNYLQLSLRMLFSLLPIYHTLKSGCNETDKIYSIGEGILTDYGVMNKFYDLRNGNKLNPSCSLQNGPS